MREKTERWRELCVQAAVEEDSTKLLALVKEINDLLEEKQKRLDRERPWDRKPEGN